MNHTVTIYYYNQYMKHHHLLLPDEYSALLQKKKTLHDEMDETGKLIADVTTQSSETYHDNA